jgi:hypothetical protein
MVDMSMADDQRLDFARIDLQETDIVGKRLGGVAEVEHDGALLLLSLRFKEKRQPPLIMQNIASVCAASSPGCLVDHTVDRTTAQELIMRLIDQDAHREFVDRRNLNRCRQCDLDTAEPGCGRTG